MELISAPWLLRFRLSVCIFFLLSPLQAVENEKTGVDAKVGELRAALAEKELEAQVEELRENTASEDKGKLVESLMEVMAKLKDLEADQKAAGPAPVKDPMKSEKIQEAVRAFEASMKSSEADESQPIQEDQLHACTLMSARRYAGAGDTSAKETRDLLERFAAAESPLSPGEAAKSVIFRGIVICLKQLGEDALADFRTSGGFGSGSEQSLPDTMAQEAESKKAHITWSGAVFQLGFDKVRWALLRRIVVQYLNPGNKGAAKGTSHTEL
jgi:hypothetical protein